MAIEIEPKIHAGFVYSDSSEPAWIEHPSREGQLLAIQEDMRYVLDNYTSQSGYLKIAGLPLIGIFAVHSLDPMEWETIVSGLEEQGYAFILMGDQSEPCFYPAINILYQWVWPGLTAHGFTPYTWT